jgi:predicted esterase
MEEFLSGANSFEIEVPYSFIDIGDEKFKPLFIYLHGFRQNIKMFRTRMEPLLDLEGYHLFVQGPYPIYDRSRDKRIEDWGRAWYLYDGNQDSFRNSLELTSTFLDDLIDDIISKITFTNLAIIGYSMGGYLAGYYALSRSDRVDHLVTIGSRIKTEYFEGQDYNYTGLNVLAVHGKDDRNVEGTPQKRSCNQLAKWGANVTYRELEGAHRLQEKYLEEAKKWIISQNKLGNININLI